MLINTVSNIYSAQASSSNGRIHQSNNVSNNSNNETAASAVTGSLDFTNMTPKELNSRLGDLVSSGKITLDESGILMTMIPTPLSKVDFDGKTPETYDQPMNFITRLQDGIEFAKSHDAANVESFTKALDALQKLQGTQIGIDLRV